MRIPICFIWLFRVPPNLPYSTGLTTYIYHPAGCWWLSSAPRSPTFYGLSPYIGAVYMHADSCTYIMPPGYVCSIFSLNTYIMPYAGLTHSPNVYVCPTRACQLLMHPPFRIYAILRCARMALCFLHCITVVWSVPNCVFRADPAAAYLVDSTPVSLYTIHSPYIHVLLCIHVFLCLQPRLGFIWSRPLSVRVHTETKALTTSLAAADASISLPSGGPALRAYGSVFIRFPYVCPAASVTTCLVSGTPFIVLLCPCISSPLLVRLAWCFWHTSPPHRLLPPMHLISALLRFGVRRNTPSVPCALCAIPIPAASHGGC
jgi:hypothetical protein